MKIKFWLRNMLLSFSHWFFVLQKGLFAFPLKKLHSLFFFSNFNFSLFPLIHNFQNFFPKISIKKPNFNLLSIINFLLQLLQLFLYLLFLLSMFLIHMIALKSHNLLIFPMPDLIKNLLLFLTPQLFHLHNLLLLPSINEAYPSNFCSKN